MNVSSLLLGKRAVINNTVGSGALKAVTGVIVATGLGTWFSASLGGNLSRFYVLLLSGNGALMQREYDEITVIGDEVSDGVYR